MHWIIGTAGHIDHGKTSLVKALTGQDTDRLKEEKERGISIDLGFAHFDLPDGARAGVVDVPGHERFIRNMLAGAHGIDLVLFTVAADDGVMPQTEEHLDIVHLLDVRRAIFVVTKADLATESRIAEVADEIRILTAGTALEGSPIVPFSAISGVGLQQLREDIIRTLGSTHKAAPSGYFRLPVDRAFVVSGHGLIVTGTAISGEIRTGDRVRCLPGGDLLRVRSLEVHNEAVDVAGWGQRIALNLTGAGHAALSRGDVVCHEKIALTADRFDVKLEVRPTAAAGLKNHQRVRVHIGTAERLGKVIPLLAPTVAPGKVAFCQIALSERVAVMRGDHVIVRDETAQRTLGGGTVILAPAPPHRKRDAGLSDRLRALERGDVAAFLEQSGVFALPLAALSEMLNRPEAEVRAHVAGLKHVHTFEVEGDRQYAVEAACQSLWASLLEALGRWHAAHPLRGGMDIEEARSGLSASVPQRIFRLLVEELADAGALVRDGNLLRLPGHRIDVPDKDRALVDRIGALLRQSPLAPPDLKQLTDTLSVDRARLIELMRAMEKQGSIVSVAPDLYFHREAVDDVRRRLADDLAGQKGLTAAEFRDRYQTTRKYAIPLLEYFDRVGLTVRMGDVRRLKQSRVTGSA